MGDINNSKAIKSGFFYTIASFITAGMAFITTPIFTRLMPQEIYGAYNNFMSWQSILGVVITLNLGATFISARFDYRDDFNSYVLSMSALCSSVILFFLIILNVFSSFAENIFDMKIGYVNLMIAYILFSQFISIFQTKEQFDFRYKQSIVIGLIVSVASSLLAILLVYSMPDKYCGRVIGHVAPTIVMGGAILIVLFGKGSIRVTYWKYALPICLPYIPHLLSLTLLNSVDRIMIRKMWGETETALYSLAYTCSSVVTILMSSMNTAYSPWLARKLEKKEHEDILKFSYVYVLSFVFLLIGILLLAPEVLLILGGENYSEAKYVMPPVMAGCAMQLLYTMHVNIEQFQKKTVGMAIASVCSALINYILNLWLIPKFGYVVAAYTTWISYICLLLAHMFLVSRLKVGRVYNEKFVIAVTLFCSSFMFLVNVLYKNNGVRYVLLTIYIVVLIFFLIKYKNKLIKLLKNE